MKEFIAAALAAFLSLFGGSQPEPAPGQAAASVTAAIEETYTPAVSIETIASDIPASTTPATVAYPEPAVPQPIVVEQIVTTPIPTPDTVTRAEFEAAIAALRTDLLSLIAQSLPKAFVFSGAAPSTPVSTATFAASQRIDQLSGTRLSDITVDRVTGLTDTDIPDTITASNYLPIAGGTISGGLLVTASSTFNASTTFPSGMWGANGKVGIGTLSPAAQLDVNGTFAVGGVSVSASSTARQWVANANYNSVDTSPIAYILGGGANGWPNIIGTTTLPRATDFSPIDWSADTAYPTGAADVSLIVGGYDNIVNQEAGIIVGGGHNFLKYNSGGHSIIGGGSYNVIYAGRSGIFSGRRNTVTGSSKVFSFIGGGDDNNIVGNWSVIPGGRSNAVTGDYSLAFGRRASTTGNGIIALSDSTDADFSVGTSNVFGARYSGGYWLTGGNVGIGKISPTAKLDVVAALDADTAIARFYDSSSDMALDIRSYTGGSGLAAKHIDLVGISSASDMAFSPSSDTRRALVLKDGGNVGVATTTPWRKLSVVGTVGFDGLTGATGAGSLCLSANREVVYNSASDSCLPSLRATKHDIAQLNFDALALVSRLEPVSFVYNDGDGRTRWGFIAEDAAAVDPHLATYDASSIISGIDDRSMLALIVRAVQKLVADMAGFADRITTRELTFVRATGDEIDVAKLCVRDTAGSTCITRAQLDALLNAAGQSAVPSPTPADPPADPTPEEVADQDEAADDAPSIVPEEDPLSAEQESAPLP